jgi:hypothetical protein
MRAALKVGVEDRMKVVLKVGMMALLLTEKRVVCRRGLVGRELNGSEI